MNSLKRNNTVLITKSYSEAREDFDLLKENGFSVIPFPTIRIAAVKDLNQFREYIKKMHEFDYLVFTSANSVEIFSDMYNVDFDLKNVKIVAVGSKTAKTCQERKITVNIIPDEFNSNSVIKTLQELDLKNKNILWPCSALSDDILKESLEEVGANVFKIPVYDVLENQKEFLEKEINEIESSKPLYFAFTSPSSIEHYISILEINNVKEYFNTSYIIAIGNKTKDKIEEYGVIVNSTPDESTISGIVKKIIETIN